MLKPDIERHIAINRLAIGNTRKTDATWDYAAIKAVLLRPSTYLFFRHASLELI